MSHRPFSPRIGREDELAHDLPLHHPSQQHPGDLMSAGESDVELFDGSAPKPGGPRLGEPSDGWRGDGVVDA